MIKYALICQDIICAHEFEAWFSSSADFDTQAKAAQLICPECQSINVAKAIMAPNIKPSNSHKRHKLGDISPQNQAAQDDGPNLAASSSSSALPPQMIQAVKQIRAHLAENCYNVGDKFSDQARAMHYGEMPKRAIYGTARAQEIKSLCDDGIALSPLPDICVPKPSLSQDISPSDSVPNSAPNSGKAKPKVH